MGERAHDEEFCSCLADAGCDERLIDKCRCLRDDGMPAAVSQLLDGHRAELLNQLHGTQRQIDCLDHAIRMNTP